VVVRIAHFIIGNSLFDIGYSFPFFPWFLFPSSITADGFKKWEFLEAENWPVFYGLVGNIRNDTKTDLISNVKML